jgi:hypothetical protein
MSDLGSMISIDLVSMVVMTGGSLLAVWIPLLRGLSLCRRARAATRTITASDAKAARDGAAREGEPLGVMLVRVIEESLRDLSASGTPEPRAFVVDAARQCVEEQYDRCYARRISMHANILPPIGFIGTTAGMLILFLSMRVSSASLELGALALALTSSLFALLGFATLEALKIRLYGRLLGTLDHVLARVPTAT